MKTSRQSPFQIRTLRGFAPALLFALLPAFVGQWVCADGAPCPIGMKSRASLPGPACHSDRTLGAALPAAGPDRLAPLHDHSCCASAVPEADQPAPERTNAPGGDSGRCAPTHGSGCSFELPGSYLVSAEELSTDPARAHAPVAGTLPFATAAIPAAPLGSSWERGDAALTRSEILPGVASPRGPPA